MKNSVIALFACVVFAACATTKNNSANSNDNDENGREPAAVKESAGREPAAMVGNQDWLNEVRDDFSRIAAETSSRTVASRKPDVLVSNKRWSFQYLSKNNQFTLKLDGANYSMIQTSLDDQNQFSFAAEGQTETPITLTVTNEAKRTVAEAKPADATCAVELSFWDAKNKKYVKDAASVQGTRCDKMIQQLRSYVP